MIVTHRYTTQSGSVYEVKTIREGSDKYLVRRIKLGDKHAERGPEQVERRSSDGLDEGCIVKGFQCHGVGYRMLIVLDRVERPQILTGPVISIEEVV